MTFIAEKPIMGFIPHLFIKLTSFMTKSSNKLIDSPCINQCCLDAQDVCLGCFRSIDEIVHWRSMSEQQRALIITECGKAKSKGDAGKRQSKSG